MHPDTGFARNTLLNENTFLVCCFLQLHDAFQLNFGFYKIYLLGWPPGECCLLEKIGVPDSKDHWTLLVPTEVCNTDWGVLITHTDVTVLWHPWVGMTKQPVEVHEISSGYLLKDHHWSIFDLVISVKMRGVQYNTPFLSCCREDMFGECDLYPEGTASTFGKDSACPWHVDRPNLMWDIVIGMQVHYYI